MIAGTLAESLHELAVWWNDQFDWNLDANRELLDANNHMIDVYGYEHYINKKGVVYLCLLEAEYQVDLMIEQADEADAHRKQHGEDVVKAVEFMLFH